MFVVGGSYQTSLVDPAPITDETGSLMIYDMEASTFHAVAPASNSEKPPHLVFPSVFQLNPD